MLPPESPDRIHVAFDDHRLVGNAGLILPATLALRLGLLELADEHVDLGHSPGRANTGDKLMTLVASAPAGVSGVRWCWVWSCLTSATAALMGGIIPFCWCSRSARRASRRLRASLVS